jgi:hypothetical protein
MTVTDNIEQLKEKWEQILMRPATSISVESPTECYTYLVSIIVIGLLHNRLVPEEDILKLNNLANQYHDHLEYNLSNGLYIHICDHLLSCMDEMIEDCVTLELFEAAANLQKFNTQ